MSSILTTSSSDSYWSLTTGSNSTLFLSACSSLSLDSDFDEDEPVSLEDFIITLRKENGKFGMSVKLSFDDLHRFEGFKVTQRQYPSQAFRDLEDGDVILGVNNIIFRKYNVHNALDILAAEGKKDEIHLRIRFVVPSWQEEEPQVDYEIPNIIDSEAKSEKSSEETTEKTTEEPLEVQPPKRSLGRRILRALKNSAAVAVISAVMEHP